MAHEGLVDKRAYLNTIGCLIQDSSLIDDIDRPLGHAGICFTEHESITSSLDALKYYDITNSQKISIFRTFH